jgi:uncharacterized membrane protein YgcG
VQTITPTPRLEANVFKKLTLATAAGVGYVLGAKAGRERYNQIEAKFREIAGMPAVQNATQTIKEQASTVADTAKSTVNEKAGGGSGSSGSGSSGSGGSGSGGASGGSPSTSVRGQESLTEEVVVVDLGTGANTGATTPGAGRSDTV